MTSPIPVLTVSSGADWEARLVGELAGVAGRIRVVRRCVDLAELLAAAAAGHGRAALVAADTRRLDLDAVATLHGAGVATVGLRAPDDPDGDNRLRALGFTAVVELDADAAAVGAAVELAVRELAARTPPGPGQRWAFAGLGGEPRPATDDRAGDGAGGRTGDRAGGRTGDRAGDQAGDRAAGRADGTATVAGDLAAATGPQLVPAPPGAPRTPGPSGSSGRRGHPTVPARRRPGILVAVWGPTGAPGRTTVAATLGAELAALSLTTLLVDADVYGGALAAHLGVLDEAPGLAAVTRQANAGTLTLAGLVGHTLQVLPGLTVLTGIARADRWPEIRPSALDVVWTYARDAADVVVVDCGFCLEVDEELSFDSVAPRRNGATLAVLEAADVVLAVAAADPVGLQRLVRALDELHEVVPDARVEVVANRVRRGPVGADPEGQVTAALHRFAGVEPLALLPEDRAACDAALLRGRTVSEVARDSRFRREVAVLARALVAAPAAVRRAS